MRISIISTIKLSETERENITRKFKQDNELVFLDTTELKLAGCVGCNDCWLVTPGYCRLKDDMEIVLKEVLQSDQVYFVTEGKNGFISYKLKTITERLMPLVTMKLKIKKGAYRHVSRYKKKYRFGVIYSGESDKAYIEEWLKCFMINMLGETLGVYELGEIK